MDALIDQLKGEIIEQLNLEDLKNLPDLIEVSLIGGEFFLTKKNKEIY